MPRATTLELVATRTRLLTDYVTHKTLMGDAEMAAQMSGGVAGLLQLFDRGTQDRKELEMLATKLDELLQPVTVLNWKDVLNSWKALIDLHGKLYGRKSQAILRNLFDHKELMDAIGMADQCRDIQVGENSNLIPAQLIDQFTEGTTATLRRDEFAYTRAINSEIANIERVAKRQSQFVGFLASIVLSVFIGVSNLVSIWLAAKLDLEGLNDGSA